MSEERFAVYERDGVMSPYWIVVDRLLNRSVFQTSRRPAAHDKCQQLNEDAAARGALDESEGPT